MVRREIILERNCQHLQLTSCSFERYTWRFRQKTESRNAIKLSNEGCTTIPQRLALSDATSEYLVRVPSQAVSGGREKKNQSWTLECDNLAGQPEVVVQILLKRGYPHLLRLSSVRGGLRKRRSLICSPSYRLGVWPGCQVNVAPQFYRWYMTSN